MAFPTPSFTPSDQAIALAIITAQSKQPLDVFRFSKALGITDQYVITNLLHCFQTKFNIHSRSDSVSEKNVGTDATHGQNDKSAKIKYVATAGENSRKLKVPLDSPTQLNVGTTDEKTSSTTEDEGNPKEQVVHIPIVEKAVVKTKTSSISDAQDDGETANKQAQSSEVDTGSGEEPIAAVKAPLTTEVCSSRMTEPTEGSTCHMEQSDAVIEAAAGTSKEEIDTVNEADAATTNEDIDTVMEQTK
ncbi:hypothetical protein ACMFMG_005353 [Clarireedia jacksonii]